MADDKPSQQAINESAATMPADPMGETLAPGVIGPADNPAVGPPELRDHPRYQVIRLLGQGGMGAVYQAVHKVMDRTVALKVMRPDLTGNMAAVERFRREVKAAAQLVHPNIVTAYDAEQVGSVHFLVMEYVDGRTLAAQVATEGPLPIASAADCIAQAAEGLQYAFEKRMIHRDIKPHNLMRARPRAGNQSSLVKILDFGLARFASEEAGGMQTASGLIIGTVDFMAPEQADNSRNADIRSDIYSLGCTFYYLLSGRVPFPDGTVIQRLMAHVERQPPSLRSVRPDLPPGLIVAVERMLAKKPADRFQSPADVIRAVAAFRDGDNVPVVQLAEPPRRKDPDTTVLDAIAADAPPEPKRAAPVPALAAPSPPRKSRVMLGCFLLTALTILSVTGLGVYGIWLVVNRVGSGVNKLMDDFVQQSRAWDQLDKDFVPPGDNANIDEVFPKRLGELERRMVDDDAAIPDLNLDLKGRHAVYGQGGQEVHLYAFQPVKRLEKEALFRRAMDLADKDQKTSPTVYSSISGSPQGNRLAIHVERTQSSGKAVRVRANLWWSHDWLCVLRTPLSQDPEPLLKEYLQWLSKNASAK